MSDPDNPFAWIAKAENDLLNIRNNLAQGTVPWDTICFHAQQAAEKMLKAFLVWRRVTPPRSHDLAGLLGECIAQGGAFQQLLPDCQLLTRSAVESRYPMLNFEPTEADGREAFAAAERVCTAIRSMIGAAQPP